MRNFKKILLYVLCIITMMLFIGCSKEDEAKNTISEFNKNLNERAYDTLYENISKESKENITKEEFIKRYTNIYSAIDARNIKVEINEYTDESNIILNVEIDTIAGKLQYEDVKVSIVKEEEDYKLVWNESLILPPMKPGDLVRVEVEDAKRGNILDKDDDLLAFNDEVNSINIHPEVFNQDEDNLEKVSKILDISESYIVDTIKDKPIDQAIYLLDVSPYENDIIEKLSKINGVIIKSKQGRVYKNSEAFGSLLGYVGTITGEELEKVKGYTPYDKIGKAGLEKVYEDKLREKDGVYIYLERNEEIIDIAKTDPKNGEDIKLSIDSSLQEKVYKEMKNDKGASISVHPKTGEVLSMVSSPSYNSNTMVTYKTKSIAKKWDEQENIQSINNSNNAYSPGSTMKLLTSAIGLENKVINPDEKISIEGKTWQNNEEWGDYYVTRVKDEKDNINLYDAVVNSDNIYFAQSAINIGEKDYIEGLKKFGVGDEIPFEYPMQKSQISNDGKLNKEVLLADTGYGQGEVLMTPLDVSLYYTTLVNDGNIMTPRLVISENTDPSVYKEAISKDNIDILKRCFKGVIDDEEGSGNLAKIKGKNIFGKTGTAEIKDSKDDEDGSENGWFVAVNDDISISMIIEDIDKSTSEYVVPRVKNVLEYYLK